VIFLRHVIYIKKDIYGFEEDESYFEVGKVY
jgi:hypothetical protein